MKNKKEFALNRLFILSIIMSLFMGWISMIALLEDSDTSLLFLAILALLAFLIFLFLIPIFYSFDTMALLFTMFCFQTKDIYGRTFMPLKLNTKKWGLFLR